MERQYRRALPLDQAMAVVLDESGKSYDPRVVEILVGVLASIVVSAVTPGGQKT